MYSAHRVLVIRTASVLNTPFSYIKLRQLLQALKPIAQLQSTLQHDLD